MYLLRPFAKESAALISNLPLDGKACNQFIPENKEAFLEQMRSDSEIFWRDIINCMTYDGFFGPDPCCHSVNLIQKLSLWIPKYMNSLSYRGKEVFGNGKLKVKLPISFSVGGMAEGIWQAKHATAIL